MNDLKQPRFYAPLEPFEPIGDSPNMDCLWCFHPGPWAYGHRYFNIAADQDDTLWRCEYCHNWQFTLEGKARNG